MRACNLKTGRAYGLLRNGRTPHAIYRRDASLHALSGKTRDSRRQQGELFSIVLFQGCYDALDRCTL